MPFPHPKSLSNDETYAVVAYLLSLNEIEIEGEELEDEYVLNREKFLKIKMPNEDGFYPPVDGPDGSQNMKKFLSNPDNYGKGERCMKDCIKGEVPVVRIKNELNDFDPPLSTIRDLPKDEGKKETSKAEKIYNETCSACHANEAIGAPVVGNKEAWSEVMKKGLEEVYKNAINGLNTMPPKGGNMDLSDEDVKSVVDWMIQSSK